MHYIFPKLLRQISKFSPNLASLRPKPSWAIKRYIEAMLLDIFMVEEKDIEAMLLDIEAMLQDIEAMLHDIEAML